MGAVIPLSDATRRPVRFPIVTLGLIVANFVVFGFEIAGGEPFVLRWAATPANIAAGGHWITLFTSMFLHGSWSHILGNMVFLWAFGPEVEDAMGSPRYLAFYLLGGLVAMGAQIAMNLSSTAPNLGASGAIAAVMGAFLVTYPQDEIRVLLVILIFVRVAFIPAAVLIGVWFLTQLANVGSVASVQGGGVAYIAHVCGLLFGAAAGKLFERQGRVAA
ncbi:MAG TPA: rhomboid family intramembrane serine protease [Gemmatimonadaceae bacterium]|nr:rhomboid family intramembrane serine protease [Gemmatimonadaceae bacterium]